MSEQSHNVTEKVVYPQPSSLPSCLLGWGDCTWYEGERGEGEVVNELWVNGGHVCPTPKPCCSVELRQIQLAGLAPRSP